LLDSPLDLLVGDDECWVWSDFLELPEQPVSQRSFVEVERRLGEDGDEVSGISRIGDGGSWGVIILKERSRLWPFGGARNWAMSRNDRSCIPTPIPGGQYDHHQARDVFTREKKLG
jgi:hypothetical protein